MSTLSTETTPAVVWMREDGHLVVSIPVKEIPGRNMAEIRSRLLDGLTSRWPLMSLEDMAGFVKTVGQAPLEVFRVEEGGPEVVHYGAVLT